MTGVGLVSPLGIGTQANWEALKDAEKGRNSVMWPTFTWQYRARTKQFDPESYTEHRATAGASA